MSPRALALLATLLLTSPAFPAEHPGPPGPVPADQRALENGLLPAVIVAGDAHPGRSLTEEMKQHHVPAISVAIIHHGSLYWAKAWGTLDVQGGRPATPDSLFQAASISKSLASMAALHLVQEGKLSLDAPIDTELKSWKLPQNEFTAQQPVTLRELLSHTAGTNVHGFPGYATTERVPSLHEVLDGQPPANTPAIRVVALPGQAFSYSGGGYTIAQQAMIDAAGRPFPQIMQSLVLGPLSMRHSTYQQPLPEGRLKEVAMPADDQGRAIAGGPHTYPEMAAAGLWTTPSDLALWVMEMQRSRDGHANHVLSPETTRLMLTAVKGDYGLGVGLGQGNGHSWFSHSGGNAGYRTFYIGYDNGEGAVIMTSGDDGGALYQEVLRGLSKLYDWPSFKPAERADVTLPPATIARYAGKFTAQSLGAFELTREKGHLQGKLFDYGSTPLFPASESIFFATDFESEVQFDSADSGKLLIAGQSYPFSRSR